MFPFHRLLLPALTLSAGALSPSLHAWTAAVSAGFETRHIYRGVDSGMDGAITWQSTAVQAGDASLGYWYGTGPNTAYEEVDLFGSYLLPLNEWELVAGFLWYHFPDDPASDSTDLTLTLRRPIALDDTATFSPFVYLSYNLDVEGTYAAAGFDYHRTLAPGWSLHAQMIAAISSGLRPDDGFDHLEGTVALTRTLRENAHLRVFFSHSFAGAAIEAISPDETWGGGTLTVSF